MPKLKNVADIYPLSPLQQGLLFHALYAPEEDAYHQQLTCTLRGPLNVEAFRQAWQFVVQRHPSLRTAFLWEGLEEPLQVVRERVEIPWSTEEWTALPSGQLAAKRAAFLQAERQRSFPLSQAPLLRLALLHTEPEAWEFVLSYHHLLLDGWSLAIVLEEIFAAYTALSQELPLPQSSLHPYRHYIAWLERQNRPQAETFWKTYLGDFHAPTPVGLDLPGLENVTEEGRRYAEQHLSLAPATTRALNDLARRFQLTLNTLVQGAWALLLSRMSGTNDLVYGSTFSGRPADLPGIEKMVGLLINTLPIRVRVPPQEELLPWLHRLQENVTELQAYEYSPLVHVQGWSGVPHNQPLFESLFVFENYPLDAGLLQGIRQLSVENVQAYERTNYPLTAIVVPGASIQLRLSYDRQRFDDQTVQRTLGHWQTLIESFAADPRQRLAHIPWLTPGEQSQIVVEWNDTQAPFPQERCLHELVSEQARRTPRAVAVAFDGGEDDGQSLTYAELERRANQLAHHLRRLGVGPDERVAICMERSLELVVGLLGILKAGAAYVPLDPGYPPERLAFMLADARAGVLLTQERLTVPLPAHEARVICLDSTWGALAGQEDTDPALPLSPDNLAYVIYTSGSTGRPKGAMNSHRGIVNRLHWMQQAYRLMAEDRVLQKTPYSFDVSVWEFFWPLLVGARLILAQPGGHQDSAYLAHLIAAQKITTLHFVPSMLQAFLETEGIEKLTSLKRVICSGEALPFAIQERFYACLPAELHNLYGPTEAAVDVTAWACPRRATRPVVPIGFPIANIQTYILDPGMHPTPVGVAGELYLGGVGLGRGYLDRPDLTAERFTPNPFATEDGFSYGSRLYRSGDRARYLPGGEIEFLGRLDDQVKIRGFRIELGEIETVLRQHPAVREVAVLARPAANGDRRLVAYLSCSGAQNPSVEALRHLARQKLPDYMVPAAFLFLDHLPLSPNGKLDRRALPDPDWTGLQAEVAWEGPRTPIEEHLLHMWQDALGVERISIHHHFFEIGGHSLLATRIVSQIRKTWQIELPVRALFEHPTIAGLAETIEATMQARLLEQLDQLSEEEAQALLERGKL